MDNEGKFDRQDLLLLAALQQDSQRSIAALAAAINVSLSACHRRIRALEAQGIITGYGARLDPARLGLNLHALIEIRLASQSRDAMDRFENAVRATPEILECELLSGSADYRLRVSVKDIVSFDTLHRQCLADLPGVTVMQTSFVLRTVKAWRGLDLGVSAPRA